MRRRGFTLVEVIVMSAVFSVFALTALTGMTLVLRFWRQSTERLLAEQNCRVAMQAVTAELRQAVVDPDPGASSQPTGYLSLSPAVAPTAVLTPNANSTTANSIVFTEPAPAYDPLIAGFTDTSPANYQRVSYFVQSNSLHRQVIVFSATGGVASTRDDVVVSASSKGTLLMSTQYQSPEAVKVQFATAEGVCTFTLACTVRGVGR